MAGRGERSKSRRSAGRAAGAAKRGASTRSGAKKPVATRSPQAAKPQRSRGKKASRSRASTGRAAAGARTGARALVEQLEVLGVEVVFGLPGVHNLAIFDALRSSSIRTVVTRHEQAAAYAADGYARATGKLGVCVTTTGPGAANAAAAMGEARASRSPVLHISTQSETKILENRTGRFSLHESPQQRELMGAVSRWTATVMRAEAIPSLVARASTEAFAARRGPVFLEIPFDLLAQTVRWTPRKPVPGYGSDPDPRFVERAAARLAAAKRPVIWAGGGAVSSDAGEVLLAVAERLDAPVVTSFSGKGIVPADHPLAVGFPPHQPEVTALLRSSDAVLLVGTDLDGMNTQAWRLPLPRPRISINRVAEDARRNYASDVIIDADATAALEQLLPLLPSRRTGQGARRAAKARDAADAALTGNKDFKAPYRMVRRIEQLLPEGCIVIADMAVAGYWMAAYHRPATARRFQYPMGWGTLGFALPAAIGAAASGARVLVVTGDGGLMFAPGELATIVQERLPVTVLAVNDEGYGMLRYDERERFGDTFAADLHTPDLLAMASSFGLDAHRATQRDLAKVLRDALAADGPAFVELRATFAPPLTTSPRWPLKGKKEARP